MDVWADLQSIDELIREIDRLSLTPHEVGKLIPLVVSDTNIDHVLRMLLEKCGRPYVEYLEQFICVIDLQIICDNPSARLDYSFAFQDGSVKDNYQNAIEILHGRLSDVGHL